MIDDYVVEFERLAADATASLDQVEALSKSKTTSESHEGSAAATALKSASYSLREMQHCLSHIELHVRSLGSSERDFMLEHCRQRCRVSLEGLQRRHLLLRRATTPSGGVSGQGAAAAPQERSNVVLERTERANRTLDAALGMAIESEYLNAETLRNLNEQRETLRRVQESTKSTGESLRDSNSILSRVGNWWSSFM